MEQKTGFLFMINISQRDMVEYNLNLDFNDMAIYALFKHLAISKAARISKIDNDTFYQFTASFVIEQLPMLGISTRQNINRRIHKLIDAGLIEPYKNNQKECVSLFKFGKMHYAIHDRIDESECNEKVTPPVTKKLHTCNEKVTPPVTKKLHNNNTIDNINNNKVVEEGINEKPTTTPDKSEFKSELIWQMEYEKDEAKKKKLTDWAKQTISEQLPRILTVHGKQYTNEQLTAWIDQQLIKKPIELLKTKFTPYGHPLSSDTVNHIVNTANWQLTNKGGLDIPQMKRAAVAKKANNHSSPFK